MSDTRNCDNLNVEKKLPGAVTKMAFKSIAIWSIVRIQILNRLTVKEKSQHEVIRDQSAITSVSEKVRRVIKEVRCLLAFVLAVLRSRNAEVIIRVNSFSILGEREGRVLFSNGNVQDIYDQLLKGKVDCLVIVNDQSKYKLQTKPTGAVLYPLLLLPFLIGKAFLISKRRVVNRIVRILCENLSLDRLYVQRLISIELGSVFMWKVIYKFITPKIVYYDCPHNCFESEIVAAKLNNIKTIEIYHGGITQDEPSYYQRHLDFDGLEHAVCDEFLSPSEKQTQFLTTISDKYKKVTTVKCISTLPLSAKHQRDLVQARSGHPSNKRKLLLITSITDYDIFDVRNYIERNRQYLLDNFNVIALRLHPEDTQERWQSLLDTYRFIELSKLTLSDDIASADALVVVSPTVMLQLKALNIEYVDLSRSAI